MLILSCVGIAILTGENSIIKNAIQAKDATNEAEVRERVECEVLGSYDRKGKLNKEKLKQRLKDDLEIQENQIVDSNEDDEFNVPLEFPLESYDVEVKPNGDINIIPRGEIPTPPTLVEGDITFNPVPSTLTNKEVKVTIKAKVSTMRLILQYSLENPDDENSWQTYTGPVTMNDNGSIYARLINEKGEKSNYITGNVENIDRKEPTITEFKVVEGSTTTNSVKVTVSASDDRQLASKGTYKFFAKEIEPVAASLEEDAKLNGYKLNGTSTESEYTYTNLEQGKSYILKVIVTDEAGNTSEKETENEVEIPKVPDLVPSPTETLTPTPGEPGKTANIIFNYEPKDWTREYVKVTITLDDSLQGLGYTLQYSTNYNPEQGMGEWKDYTIEGFKVDHNQAVYARLKDTNNQYGGVATGNITNIDKDFPTMEPEITKATTNSITVKANAKDESSGIKEENAYVYSIMEKDKAQETIYSKEEVGQEELGGASSEDEYNFVGLTQDTEYIITIIVSDKANNAQMIEIPAKTEKIPDISKQGVISFEYIPEGWTNGEETTVKINVNEEIDETKFILQYQTPAEESSSATTWQDYNKDEGFKITKNGTIYARLKEKDGEQTGTTAASTYTLFDRKAPTIKIEMQEVTANSAKVVVAESKDEQDIPEEEASGLAEQDKYTYYIETEDGEEAIATKDDTEHLYTGLSQNKEYNVRVEVKDKAGNVGTSEKKKITTQTIPDLNDEGAIEIKYDPDNWTKTDVQVSLKSKYTEEGYKLQYSKNYTSEVEETVWEEYTEEGFKVEQNGKIAIRLKLDSLIEGGVPQYGIEKEEEITWIDKKEPEVTTNVTEITKNTMK